ncbi:MAG: hypothetical protein B7Y80_02625 [Hyphomicrobium sp. 32-62-53]|nr:MAG: hypothetical protein B7Z29_02975 [Hyphomicrobium sp. 12-62-95]OYY01722.1 MAG: hypothetical protein B7Y80_02625 [Hyphomicrobium sp. 32-62-53]
MTTGSSSIDYDVLQSDAMRGVVRAVLTRTAKSGLPGDHHFYISFDTNVAGVSLSKRLKEKYPNEMTIVLQHRFWDLIVSDERFEVKLTFDGIPERLVVPFAALKVFFDPSVRYGLQFEEADLSGRSHTAASNALDDDAAAPASGRSTAKKPRAPRKPKGERETAGNQAAEHISEVPRLPAAAATAKTAKPAAASNTEAPVAAATEDDAKPDAASGAQILSLDQFRKK